MLHEPASHDDVYAYEYEDGPGPNCNCLAFDLKCGVTIKHTLGSYHHIFLYVYVLPFPWSNMPHSA
jgi:hypothetical protein